MNRMDTMKIYRFESLPSTQDFCKEHRGGQEELMAVAAKQSGGKGTKGRSFESEEGGLYCSILLRDTGEASQAFLCVARAAVAVCKTLEEFSLLPMIKWPNDIFCGGKKICGILIENVFSGKKIASTIWGIGLNINNPLGESIADIATSMRKETGETYAVEDVEQAFLKHFFAPFSYEEYQSRLGFLGRTVGLVAGDETLCATLLSVTQQGELVALVKGEERRFSYGEVSITKDSLA